MCALLSDGGFEGFNHRNFVQIGGLKLGVMKIKVLIVDDSLVVRSMLKRLFEQDERFELCPSAENGRDAIKKNDLYKPDFIIMDLNMPIMNGLESSREILSKSNPGIVAFTTEDYADVCFKSFEIGILSVIRKPDLAKMKQSMLQDFIDKIYFIAQSHIQKNQREKIDDKSKSLKITKISKTSELGELNGENTNLSEKEFFENQQNLQNQNQQKKSKIYKQDFTYLKNQKFSGKYKILAIGSSTGGPGALKKVLAGLGKNFPLPVVITQHNESGFDDYLAKWLTLTTGMNVKIAQNYEILKAGTAYLAPSNFHLTLTKKDESCEEVFIKLDSGAMVNFMRPAVDKMFESVAEIFGKHAIALILTGMGKDGAASCKKLFDCGAFTIAEAEDDCVVFGMPRAAIEENAISCVARLDAIADVVKQAIF